MSTNMVGRVRRARKIDPNGNIYYDRGISDIIFDPVRGTSVKDDIDKLRDGLTVALAYVAANPKGLDGLSAYEIAKNHGFEGTEYEWLQSLKGAPGDDGLSAYELACTFFGFTGTMKEYLDSLKGEKGDKGDSTYDIAKKYGYEGTEEEWIDTQTFESITDEEILAIYARLTGNPDADGDDYQGLIDSINTINQRIGTMDDALQETMTDVQIDQDENILTGYKTNGTEFQRKMFDVATNDDVKNLIDNIDTTGGEEDAEKDAG